MEFKKYLLSEISDYKTGRLNSNAAIENGKYKFFTCAPNPLTINSYSYDDDVILLAGNNANGIFHINRFNGKFDAYQRTYIIKPKFDVIDIDYLYYYLKFKLNFLRSQSIGSATKYLTKPILDNLEIYSPKSKRKETIISSILKILDKKIELNKRIIANLEELSQTLFKRWFVDFEFPDENGNPYKSSGGEMIDSELGEIPSGWKVDELGNYIKIKSGKRPKNKVDKKDIENVVPIIGASKIMGYTNDYLYNEKIIIIGRVGTHGVIQRFSTRTWPSDNTFVIISDFESIIYQVLKSIDYISLNRGSTQPLLSQKDIKNTKVAMPTNETLLSTYQKENNHILKMMDQQNIENQKLTQLRDTLLPKLMSGEIEIPDDIEVNEDELSI
ncbi:TPA: restriction endonuclease subunit S [Staphylococcus aureus]|nr:restriction endonuclease subunit S [Staphylococcus aureus]HDF8456197.1 restriction endonuclease subunit S [Staphylococcus aureus]HDF9362843.1 restriction endonuclease subunit S [Staphylococcus aureus]HDF9390648.1 restriction endonuclease subunit S [Staphylococcus aureus]HDF9494964.1 restriction endonuclease subunit S [Staphylococcus aureus]